MAAHSSILAWRSPRTEEPGGLQSTGSQRVGHDQSDLARTHAMLLSAVEQSESAVRTQLSSTCMAEQGTFPSNKDGRADLLS